VFDHLDARQQDFLLRTSILDRLCGPLCHELTGFTDSAELLSQLERANLFVQSLDNRRRWFRYHPLLADLLRQRLQKAVSTADIQWLYHRACDWHEREGLLVEAVTYAAPDPEYAAALIERHVLDVFYRSEIYQVHRWLKDLPEAVLYRHPLLCAVYADTIALILFTPKAYDQAEQLLRIAESGGPLAAETVAFIAKFRAYLARFRGHPPEVIIRLVKDALDLIPEGSTRFRSSLAFLQGEAYKDTGDEAAAARAFMDAWQFGKSSGDWFNALAAVAQQAQLLIMHGKLREAASLCRDVLETVLQAQGGAVNLPPVAGVIYTVLGSLLVEWNELEEAEKHLIRAQEMLEPTTLPGVQVQGYLALARLKAGRRNAQAALEAIQKAVALPNISKYIAPYKICALLVAAEYDSAARATVDHWALDQRLDAEHAGRENLDQFALARWLVLRESRSSLPDHPSRPLVRAFLEEQLETARRTQRTGRFIEILILQALICQEQGQTFQALELLGQALASGEPEGYIRLFAEFGSSLAPLLALWVDQRGSSSYAACLLEIIERENSLINQGETSQSIPQALPGALDQKPGGLSNQSALVETLSDREMEVLRLLAEGLSNQQIASRLHLSPNTVRIHASTIYGKLGVGSRTQAAAKARALGLLS
jgi:LuxR family maltose regulon positive regulatory protein